MTPEPGAYVLAGGACWFLGCLCWLAAGIARLVETLAGIRARRRASPAALAGREGRPR
ncbi:hypothetical protein [Streptomyces sp. NPDC002692]